MSASQAEKRPTQQEQVRREHRRTQTVLGTRHVLHLPLQQLRTLRQVLALPVHVQRRVVLRWYCRSEKERSLTVVHVAAHVALPATTPVDELHERVHVQTATLAALHAHRARRHHRNLTLPCIAVITPTPSTAIGRKMAPNGIPARPCSDVLLGAIS